MAIQTNAYRYRCGYILPLTLVLLSGIMVVVTYLFTHSSFYVPYAREMVVRIKAQELTRGGLQIALATLANITNKSQQDTANMGQEEVTGIRKVTDKKQEKKEVDEDHQLLGQLLPVINRWQEHNFTRDVDGFDGNIKFCVMCEEGKIDINACYDHKKGAFVGPMAQCMPVLIGLLENKLQSKGMLTELKEFLKKRTYPVVDVTELLTLKSFSSFKNRQFYEPPKNKHEVDQIYLTDLFTTHTGKATIEPWLMSNSWLGLFGARQVQPDDLEWHKKESALAVAHYKKNINWAQVWDETLKKIYNKSFKSFPQIMPNGINSIFTNTFASTLFSVLVHGTVGSVTERLYAIVSRTKRIQDNVSIYDITIKRIYWL